MISGAIPHYLHSEPIKPVKGQAAICDWISNMGFAFDKIKVYMIYNSLHVFFEDTKFSFISLFLEESVNSLHVFFEDTKFINL